MTRYQTIVMDALLGAGFIFFIYTFAGQLYFIFALLLIAIGLYVTVKHWGE